MKLANGKSIRKAVLGKTREEVATKVAKGSYEAFRGAKLADPAKMTVGEYVFGWVMRFKRAEISNRTLEWYINIVKRHIEPALGELPLPKLTTYHIQELLTDLKIKSQVSSRTIQGVRDTLSQALEAAVNMELILKNPVRGVKMPREERDAEESKAIPIELRHKILEGVADDPIMKPIITTLMFTGLRSGELLALTWEHVNFTHGVIFVQSAVINKPEIDASGRHTGYTNMISAPKTRSSVRKVKAPSIVLEVLSEWKTHIGKTCQSNYVFCTRSGALRTYAGLRSAFRRFLAREGIETHLSLHSFRHTFATMLMENGINPRIIQRMLGHADVSMTLGIYTHAAQEVFDDVANVLGNIHTATLEGSYSPRLQA